MITIKKASMMMVCHALGDVLCGSDQGASESAQVTTDDEHGGKDPADIDSHCADHFPVYGSGLKFFDKQFVCAAFRIIEEIVF